MFVIGGMDSLVSLSYISDTVMKDWLVIFGYQIEETDIQNQIDLSRLIVFKDNKISDLALILVPSKYRIDTYPFAAQSISVNSSWVRSGWSWIPDSIGYNVYLLDNFRPYQSEFSLGGDYILTRSNTSLSIPFSVDMSGIFDVWARVFYRNDAGSLTFWIDDLNITSQGLTTISPKTQEGIYGSYSGFEWIKLTPQSIFLNKGHHTLLIQNEDGLNAIDDIVIAPSNEIIKAFDIVKNILKEKEFIYILEAEKAFSSIEDEWMAYPSYSSEASMGGVIMTFDPRFDEHQIRRPISVSEPLYIPKDGHYTLSLKICTGNQDISSYLKLFLDDNLICNLSSFPKNLTYLNVDLMNLIAGEHELKIRGFGSVIIDQLVLYSSSKNQEHWLNSIDSILSVESALDLTVQRINPTHFIVNSTSKEPFFLVFSETYNPFWYLNCEGEELKSLIAYSFLNSFYISNRGTFNVEYIPQIYMYADYLFAFFIIIIGIFYILFNIISSNKNLKLFNKF